MTFVLNILSHFSIAIFNVALEQCFSNCTSQSVVRHKANVVGLNSHFLAIYENFCFVTAMVQPGKK